MQNSINIKINGLSASYSIKVVEVLKKLLYKYSFLDFRRFSNIVITTNLNYISKKRKYYSFKDNNSTLAMVLTIPKDDDFELLLVIKSNFIKNIIEDENSINYKNALHILHHEFAHIHDNNKKIDAFKEFMRNDKYDANEAFFYHLSEICWSEYIANFISSKTALHTDYPKQMAYSLMHKIDNDSVDLKALLKTVSYLLGYLNGMNITLEQLDEKIALELEKSFFREFWEIFKYEIASIHQVYPDGFINLNIYKKLATSIEIFYRNKHEKLF